MPAFPAFDLDASHQVRLLADCGRLHDAVAANARAAVSIDAALALPDTDELQFLGSATILERLGGGPLFQAAAKVAQRIFGAFGLTWHAAPPTPLTVEPSAFDWVPKNAVSDLLHNSEISDAVVGIELAYVLFEAVVEGSLLATQQPASLWPLSDPYCPATRSANDVVKTLKEFAFELQFDPTPPRDLGRHMLPFLNPRFRVHSLRARVLSGADVCGAVSVQSLGSLDCTSEQLASMARKILGPVMADIQRGMSHRIASHPMICNQALLDRLIARHILKALKAAVAPPLYPLVYIENRHRNKIFGEIYRLTNQQGRPVPARVAEAFLREIAEAGANGGTRLSLLRPRWSVQDLTVACAPDFRPPSEAHRACFTPANQASILEAARRSLSSDTHLYALPRQLPLRTCRV